MKKENLEEASKIIIESLNKSKIEEIDKIELMINIYHFLNYEDYNKNIKVLRFVKDLNKSNKYDKIKLR